MSARLAARALGLVTILLAASAPAVVTTGQDASLLPFVGCNGRVAFRTSEAQQGNTNLNGDTDTLDSVLQVVDLGTNVVTNVGVDASGPLACSGDVFVFGVREANQGNADRNGDGDPFDTVLAAYNAATSTLTNIGLAVSAISASPQLVAFTVGESSQAGTDRNGDGDVLDQVLAVLDPLTLAVTNVGREAGDVANISVNGKRVAFILSEAAQGNTDFNGDGDPLDTVALFYDAVTSTVINPNRAVVPALGITLDSAVAAFVVNEATQGPSSLNADVDTTDQVVAIYCFGGPPCTGTGLVNVGVDAGGGFRLSGDLLAFRIRERNEPGPSLNPPDTDKADFVVQYYRISTATLGNTGYAGKASFRIIGNRIAFGVPENKNGHVDLNGDSDARDIVLVIYDTLTATATNTARTLWAKSCKAEPTSPKPRGTCLVSGNDMVVFPTGEKSQGAGDMNGDGDTRDAILSAWRISSGTLVNTGLAGEHKTTLIGAGTLGAFRVSEARQNANLNGDPDINDDVIAVYDDTTGTVSQLGRAVDAFLLIEGSTVVFRTNEFSQNVDLNGDGDKNDSILEYQTF